MNCSLLYRLDGGPARAVLDDDGNVFEFADSSFAVEYANNALANGFVEQVTYQVVMLDI